MTRSILICILAGAIFSGCQTVHYKVPIIHLNLLKYKNRVSIEDRYSQYFSSYNSVFLEGTEYANLEDITNVCIADTIIFMLRKDQIQSYDYQSGKQNTAFAPPTENNHFISFDISMDNTIYALTSTNARIYKMDITGKILDTIQLDSNFAYDKLIMLGSCSALLITRTLPTPNIFFVDLIKKSIKAKVLPGQKGLTPDLALKDSLNQHLGPVVFYSKTLNSIVIKPLFSNVIYQYSGDSITPFVQIKMKNKIKFKPNIYQEAHKFILCTGLWQLTDSTWLMRWQRQTTTYLGEKKIAKHFTILNSNMDIFNNTVYYNTSLIQWEHSVNIYDLNAYHSIYFYPDKKQLLKIIRHDNKKILPAHLKNYVNKQNLILCSFQQ